MTRSVQLIRLLTSVLIAFAACTFVVRYDRISAERYIYDHPRADGHWEGGEFVIGSNSIGVCELIRAHRAHAYAAPLAGLVLGILFIWRWPQFPALAELIGSAMLVLAIVWAGFVLLSWQFQNIPHIAHLQVFY